MKPLRILLSSILVVMVIGCAKEQPAEAPASASVTPAATAPPAVAPTTETAAPTSTEAEPAATSTAAATTSSPESAPGVASEAKAAASAKPGAELVATGKDLFRSKCASCHGEEGKGDTQIGRTRKLRDLASADVQSLSDEKLVEILRGGTGSLSAKAHESRALTADQIDALIAFIRSLG